MGYYGNSWFMCDSSYMFFISPEDEKNSVKKDGNVKQESTIQYNGHLYNKEDLSAKTVEWLEWYNGLSKGEQITISYVPLICIRKKTLAIVPRQLMH